MIKQSRQRWKINRQVFVSIQVSIVVMGGWGSHSDSPQEQRPEVSYPENNKRGNLVDIPYSS